MRFAIIDNNDKAMQPDEGRGLGFVQSLAAWAPRSDYQFVRYDYIAARADDLKRCRGLILSGSRFDFAGPDDQFDRGTYEKMIPEFQLLLDFDGPVLGICFGHQLLALVEEFDEQRTAFGELSVHNMGHPEDDYMVVPVHMNSSLRFTNRRKLWVQHNHKQEVTLNDGLQKYFEVVAGTDQCPVTIMQHRTKDWFGVQFHPEVGRASKKGETTRHGAAVSDGHVVMSDFVRYCLRS
jgi:GMP synthase-like glutamine amidotransferase